MRMLGYIGILSSLLATLICCGNDDGTSPGQTTSDTFNVRIASNEDITLTDESISLIYLYGINNSSESPTAQPILSQVTAPASPFQFPIEIEVELNGDPGPTACQNLESCQAMYYIDALIDVDGDGQICPGDLVPDYSMTPFQSYPIEELTTQNNEIYVKVKKGSPANCIAPSEYFQEIEGVYTLPVQLVLDEDIEFDLNAMGRVYLFGFDDDLSNPSMIPIVVSTFFPNDGLTELNIPLRDVPAPHVCKENYPCSDRYTFAVNIDLDGDGMICPGDLVQDYELSALQAYSLDELITQGAEVYLTVKNGQPSDCYLLGEPDFLGTF